MLFVSLIDNDQVNATFVELTDQLGGELNAVHAYDLINPFEWQRSGWIPLSADNHAVSGVFQ